MVILCKLYEAVVKLPDPSIPASVTTAVHAATGGSAAAMAVTLVLSLLGFIVLGFEARLRSCLMRVERRFDLRRYNPLHLPSVFPS